MSELLKTITTDKGVYSIIDDDFNRRIFKKKTKISIAREIEGYNLIKYYYNVPKLLEYNLVENEIIYEFNDDLYHQTMHQGLFEDIYFDKDKIINVLTSTFKNFEFLNENLSTNSIFFLGRISKISEYLLVKDKDYEKNIIINGEKFNSFKECVKSIIFDITRNNIVPFAITQGDPTDLNISVIGNITDFETSGKNSIINEIAIFLGCYLVNCYYFYIKYMNSAHKQYVKTLEKYNSLVKCEYCENEEKIEVNFGKLLPSKVKEFILGYLKKVKELEIIKSSFPLGPYVAMRMISPIDIRNINDKNDKYILFALALMFKKKYKTLNDIIKFIRSI